MSKKIKAFKAMNRDMTCRGFKYEEGKTYEEPKAELCRTGFHACKNPLDCFGYYSPSTSVMHEVELEDVSDQQNSDDTKIVGRKITIGARIDVPHIVSAAFEFVKEHCTNENNAEAGKAASAGSYGAASAGESGAAVSRGSAESGANGLSVARGNDVKVKGGLGAILVIAIENENNYDIKEWKSVVVDGKDIKPDTWYTLKGGKMVEL